MTTTTEPGPAEARVGYDQRDDDGQRLYELLDLFDRRDGSLQAAVVRSAREGWERSHRNMAEPDAWAEYDALVERLRDARRGSCSAPKQEAPGAQPIHARKQEER